MKWRRREGGKDEEPADQERVSRRFVLLITSGLLGVTTWTSGTGSTLLCPKCHVMKPEVMTWSESSHRDAPCATCHIKPS